MKSAHLRSELFTERSLSSGSSRAICVHVGRTHGRRAGAVGHALGAPGSEHTPELGDGIELETWYGNLVAEIVHDGPFDEAGVRRSSGSSGSSSTAATRSRGILRRSTSRVPATSYSGRSSATRSTRSRTASASAGRETAQQRSPGPLRPSSSDRPGDTRLDVHHARDALDEAGQHAPRNPHPSARRRS